MLKNGLIGLLFLLTTGIIFSQEATAKIFLKVSPERASTPQEKQDFKDKP